MIFPVGVIRPIFFDRLSVNQRLPSGPVVIPSGGSEEVGRGKSVMLPIGSDVAVAVGVA